MRGEEWRLLAAECALELTRRGRHLCRRNLVVHRLGVHEDWQARRSVGAEHRDKQDAVNHLPIRRGERTQIESRERERCYGAAYGRLRRRAGARIAAWRTASSFVVP